MYQKHFGFTALPFASAPDPKVFYSNPVYQDALSKLRYGVVMAKGPMVLTGAAGTGKTALLNKLFDDLGSTVKPIWFAGSDISFAGILGAMLAEVDAEAKTTDLSEVVEALYQALLKRRRAGVISCLIVEEAERLERETIERLTELCHFEAERQKLLQLILVGRPMFATKLDEPENLPVKQRMASHCQLFALTRTELDHYIQFHLETAGHSPEHRFRQDAIDRIGQYSGGVPRLVNAICENALQSAHRDLKSTISRGLIDKVAAEMGLGTDQAANALVSLHRDHARGTADTHLPIVYLPPAVESDSPSRATVTRPRRRAALICTTALLALIIFGVAGWARYGTKGVAFDSQVERPLQVEQPHFSHVTTNPANEIAQQRVQPAPLARGDAPNTMLADTQSAPTIEPPAPTTGQLQSQDKSQNKAARLVNPASQQLAKKPGGENSQQILARAAGLNLKVQKAIRNRAIKGVSARVVNGTVYLEGLVASEQQKSVAERTARGVPGVVRLRNQINVRPAN